MRRKLAAGLLLVLTLAATAARAENGELLARGEQLFHIGGCTSCHTAKGGPLLAGGDPLVSPFGTFYPPNITPDRTHGIGGWSDADFIQAMQRGLSPEGEPYYPAFPYTSYTRMWDDDLKALKAWLDTVPPVAQPSRPHDLPFPFNIRRGLHSWQLLFFWPERFKPDPSRSDSWNRGAYLTLGPGHCIECHTPRNFAGVLDQDRAFAGAPSPEPGGGMVPNLTSDPKDGLGNWSIDEIVNVLKIGMLPDGDFVGGGMGKVVNNATSKLPDSDLRAIAEYLKSLPPR